MFFAYIPGYIEYLKELKFARMSTQIACNTLIEFILYLEGKVQSIESLEDSHLREFLDIRGKLFHARWGRPLTESYIIRLHDALKPFFLYLKSLKIPLRISLREEKNFCEVPGFEAILTQYGDFLLCHKGLARGTIYTHMDHASRFCRFILGKGRKDFDMIEPEEIYEHLRILGQNMKAISIQGAQSSLRSFFRFLFFTQKTLISLDKYLLSFRSYSLSNVPAAVSIKDFQTLLRSTEGNMARDYRDKAVLVLLGLYGLRIGEITSLTFDDIDFRKMEMVIKKRKSGRPLCLPLYEIAATCLVDYIRYARPRVHTYREIFITRRCPHPYLRGSCLGMTLRERFKKLGIDAHPHAFRHMLATYLLDKDCSLPYITSLLGHECLSSTLVYTKIDKKHLQEVADNYAAQIPWKNS